MVINMKKLLAVLLLTFSSVSAAQTCEMINQVSFENHYQEDAIKEPSVAARSSFKIVGKKLYIEFGDTKAELAEMYTGRYTRPYGGDLEAQYLKKTNSWIIEGRQEVGQPHRAIEFTNCN